MSGNSQGRAFVLTTFGESHGPALGGVIDGCPPGLPIDSASIQQDLDRRKPGRNAHTTQRQESDQVEILSGVFEGVTTGTPIGLLIRNKDQRSADYSAIKDVLRPGHADFTYWQKYGIRDYRGGGRSSARETAMRVAAGSIAKAWLKHEYGTQIQAAVIQVGAIQAQQEDWSQTEENDFFFLDPTKVPELTAFLTQLREEGDSIGALIRLQCTGVPVGLGEPVFSKLDADLAGALMSINATKGISFGGGFNAVTARGSSFRDEMDDKGFVSNAAGGILGGISSGQDIVADLAFKPTSSVSVKGQTQTTSGEVATVQVQGRHDPCVALRAVAIVEAMAALVLADHAIRDRGQVGQSAWRSD